MIYVEHLTKKYRSKVVLSDVSFSCPKGSVLGIIGPNGSGKTTLLNLLVGLIPSTNGIIKVQGTIGCCISRLGFYPDMTVEANLDYYRKLLNAEKDVVENLMHQFQIDYGKMLFRKLSAGMKQRVALVIPFMKAYDVTLLDEPTNHLDIDSILRLRALLQNMKGAGRTLILTSHVTTDLERICDTILFLRAGQLVQVSSVSTLMETYGSLETAYQKISV